MLTFCIAPSGPGTTPAIGCSRRLSASAPMRAQDEPGAALAHAGERLHAASNAAGIDSIVLRYHGSRPTVSYVESRITLRTSCGKRDANTCAKNEPYESPYRSTFPSPSAVITAARSSAAGADVNRSDACTQLPFAYFQRWFSAAAHARRRLLEVFRARFAGEVLQRRAAQRRRLARAAVVHRQHVPARQQRPVHRAVARRRAVRLVGDRFDRRVARPALHRHHRARRLSARRRRRRVEAVRDRDLRARRRRVVQRDRQRAAVRLRGGCAQGQGLGAHAERRGRARGLRCRWGRDGNDDGEREQRRGKQHRQAGRRACPRRGKRLRMRRAWLAAPAPDTRPPGSPEHRSTPPAGRTKKLCRCNSRAVGVLDAIAGRRVATP